MTEIKKPELSDDELESIGEASRASFQWADSQLDGHVALAQEALDLLHPHYVAANRHHRRAGRRHHHPRGTVMTTLDPRGLGAALHAVEGQGLTPDGGTPHGWRCEHPDRYPDYCKCLIEITEAAITAYLAVTQPLVETVEGLIALGDGSVIRDKYDDVSEKRGGLWCGYETAPCDAHRMSKYLPARVIWRPHESP